MTELELYKELGILTKGRGRWKENIVFQFPVVVFGQVSDAFNFPADADDPNESFQQQETTDETVCLLYHQKKDFIFVPYEPKDAEYLKK